MDCYEKIIDPENLEAAYLEVVRRFEEGRRANRYRGVDARTLGSYDIDSLELLEEVRLDLINAAAVTPAIEVHIPKRNKPGTRPVYLHTIRERVRAQAVYRIVEPIFDKVFSKYLFSYRTSHPHYRAIRSVVRRYLQNRPSEYVLIGDIGSYSDVINPDILKQKILSLGFDEMTNRLLFLYVDMPFFREGLFRTHDEGIITGLPITVLFNNLYLNDFDRTFGERSGMYRRVGDDFIAFGEEEELTQLMADMHLNLDDLLIPKDFQKLAVVPRDAEFGFLGYQFKQGVISILPKSVANIKKKLRHALRHRKHVTEDQQINILKKVLFEGSDSIRRYFIELTRQYKHVNDLAQVNTISHYFFVRLCFFFFGSYSPRNWRRVKTLTKGMTLPSFARYVMTYQTGKLTGEDFKKIF